MSAIMVFPDPIGTFTSGRQDVLATVLCDAQADLPGADDFPGFHLIIGTKAEVMDGTLWRMLSSGTWQQQPAPHTVQLDLSGYYTSAEVDSAISSALSGYYTAVQVDSEIASALSSYYTSAQVDAAIAANNLGTAGSANENLNDFTEIGHKYWSASNASTLSNRPLGTQSGAFSAQNFPIGIDPQNPRVLQMGIYNVVSGVAQNRIFLRILSSSGWSGWFENTMTPLV